MVVFLLHLFRRHAFCGLFSECRARLRGAADHHRRHTAFHAAGPQASRMACLCSHDTSHSAWCISYMLSRRALHGYCHRIYSVVLCAILWIHSILRQEIRAVAERQLCRLGEQEGMAEPDGVARLLVDVHLLCTR